MTDVGGVADLAGLAVADDVDSGGDLLRDHILDTTPHGGIELGLVVRFAAILGEEEIDDLLRPRQAAHVRGQDPFRTPLHLRSPGI